jgi:Mg2+/citrate symporter
MYFLTACLIVLCLSAVVSFRRSRFLSRNIQGRLAAIWPSLCAGICALGLIAFDHVRDKKELGPSATTYLIMLIGAFAAGWFVGVFAESYVKDQTSRRETSARIGRVD